MKIPTAVTINNIPVSVKEWNGERVVTLKDIDTVHGRAEGTAKRNLYKNKEHFIEGIDFYKVNADEIRTNKINGISPNARRSLYLITETGYLMLVKSFTDDLAWGVQRQLVNKYFTVRQIPEAPTQPDEKKRMDVLSRYHILKSGVLIKQAEYEMKYSELIELVRMRPWLAEMDRTMRLEESHVCTKNPQH